MPKPKKEQLNLHLSQILLDKISGGFASPPTRSLDFGWTGSNGETHEISITFVDDIGIIDRLRAEGMTR